MPVEYPIAQVLSKGNQEEPGIGEIREIIRQYPYFSPAQVILAIKLQLSGDDTAFREQLRLAAIYLPEPFLLNKLLWESAGKTDEIREEAPSGNPVNPDPEISGVPENYDPDKKNGMLTGNSPAPEILQLPEALPPDSISKPEIPNAATGSSNENIEEVPAGASPMPETIPDSDELPPVSLLKPEISNLATGTTTENDLDKLIRPLYTEDYFASQGIRLPDKLDDTRKPTSAQLRSFTEWLRIMKRPRSAPDPDQAHHTGSPRISGIYTAVEDSQISPEVERMALDSINAGNEVITEAMAEIRVHQGQTQKAITIYEKLGLLNPEKSSYFAGKIAELKL